MRPQCTPFPYSCSAAIPFRAGHDNRRSPGHPPGPYIRRHEGVPDKPSGQYPGTIRSGHESFGDRHGSSYIYPNTDSNPVQPGYCL